MFSSRTVIRVKALNHSRIIKDFRDNSVSIFSLNRQSEKVMTFEVETNKLKYVKKYFNNKKINYKIIKNKGIFNIFRYIFFKIGIIIPISTFLLLIMFLSTSVFGVRVYGCDQLSCVDVTKLIEENVTLGMFSKNKIDINEISNLVLRNFKKASLVSCFVKGNYLIVSIKEKIFSEEIDDIGSFLPILSPIDGYVKSVSLSQGTSNVKAGDRVQKGDVLVSPLVVSSNGEKTPVKAIAEVTLQGFTEHVITHKETDILFERTGKRSVRQQISFLGKEIYRKSAETFDNYEVETVSVQFSSLILPFTLEKTYYYETILVEKHVPFESIKEEIVEKARENARNLIPECANIVSSDELIENLAGNVRVRVVTEFELLVENV